MYIFYNDSRQWFSGVKMWTNYELILWSYTFKVKRRVQTNIPIPNTNDKISKKITK